MSKNAQKELVDGETGYEAVKLQVMPFVLNRKRNHIADKNLCTEVEILA